MCNLGSDGSILGKIIVLNYREVHWAAEEVAPYQVILEADHSLIDAPMDDHRRCREATHEDISIYWRQLESCGWMAPSL